MRYEKLAVIAVERVSWDGKEGWRKVPKGVSEGAMSKVSE
jgi:hypothetical protein